MTPLARTLASVPVSIVGRFCSFGAVGAVRSAPPTSSASAGGGGAAAIASPNATAMNFLANVFPPTCRSPIASHGNRYGRRRRRRVVGWSEIVLEFRHRRCRQGIADHICRAAPHVEELVDA